MLSNQGTFCAKLAKLIYLIYLMKTGIVIACPNKYEEICLNNIMFLRNKLNCLLPIEIWEIGSEISLPTKKLMSTFNVIFKNVNDYCSNPSHWKGFQVKVFCLYHCEFDHAILCDADVSFYKNPEIILNDENYIRTGAYFFKDLDRWTFYDLIPNCQDKFRSLDFFNQRKNFIRKHLPIKSVLFPKEWSYVYDDDIPSYSVKEALQESGVVYINRNIHAQSLECIYKLNNDHPDTYKYVHGDKETFWIGCVMANREFYFNPTAGFIHFGCLSHAYKQELFWRQK